MNKKISIILCSYNELHYIEECISLINKTLKNVEIIIVDDNSDDGTLEKLDKLKSIFNVNETRRKIAKIYDDKFREFRHIKITKTNPGSVRHLYVIRTKRRDALVKHLFKNKISCQIHYPYSLNRLKPFKKLAKRNNNLKNSEKWSNECLSLPIHSKMRLHEVNHVVGEVKRFFFKK